jgi:hypothetical protein
MKTSGLVALVCITLVGAPGCEGTQAGATDESAEVVWADLSGVPAGFADEDDNDTLASLACAGGQVPMYDPAAAAWVCATPSDTVLSEAEVDAYVANNGYALAAELAVVATSGDYGDLLNVPEGLADGDADTLAGLGCAEDEVAKWDGALWACAPDAVLTDNDIDDAVADNGYAAAIDLAAVATSGDFGQLLNIPAGLKDGDADTLAGLGCAEGEVAKWDGAVWACAPDSMLNSSDDLLEQLACSPGDVLQWDGEAWTCSAIQSGAEPSIVNIKDYGAVGDGVTDDTQAIQDTIDAAPQNGATIVVPPGVYLISDHIHINHAGIILQGRSMGFSRQVLQPTDPLYGSVFKAAEGFSGEAMLDVGVLGVGTKQRIILENLFLYCHDQPIDGLRLLNTNNPFLAQNLAIYNCGGIGVHVPYTEMTDAVQLVAGRFNNLYVRNSGTGMRLVRMNSSVVENSAIINNTGVGIEIIGGNNNTVRDTLLEMNGAEGMTISSPSPGVYPESVLVENCRFEKNHYGAEEGAGGDSLSIDFRARGIVVMGGRFQSDYVGIRIAGDNVSVIGAEFVTGNTDHALDGPIISVESTARGTMILNPEFYTPGDADDPTYDATVHDIVDLGDNTILLGVAESHSWRGAGGSPILHVDGDSDRVGVGTESPAYSLDVSGDIRTTSGVVFPDGTVQTTACTCN